MNIIEILVGTGSSLMTMFSSLLVPAIIFFLFALLVKGKEIIAAIRRSLPNNMHNILLMSLNVILVSPIIALIDGVLASNNFFVFTKAIWDSSPHIVVIFIAVFCGDFIGYWRHRLEHSRFLWPSHLIHHSDTQMTWLTLERFHPLNRLSTFIIDTTLLLALGFPTYAIIANNLVRHYYGYFIHADLPWTYGKWGKIFVSPVMHRWHHAEEVAAHNTNFATVFSVFDQCFGTYRVPGLCNVPLGVSYAHNKNMLSQLLYPLKPKSYIRHNPAIKLKSGACD